MPHSLGEGDLSLGGGCPQRRDRMSQEHASLRSVAMISGFSLAQLVVQFVYQVLLARSFGATAEMDAYVSALALPTYLSLLLSAALAHAFLPRFVDRLEHEGEASAWRLASSLAVTMVSALGLLTAACAVAADSIVRLMVPNLPPAELERTAQVLRVLVWLTWANSLIGFLQPVYHARQRFAWPMMAAMVGLVFTSVWTWQFAGPGRILLVSVGTVLGSLLTVLLLSKDLVRNFRWQGWRDADLGRVLQVMLPLMAASAYTRVDPLLDRYLASGMPTGNIAHLGYASRLIQALLIVSTSSLSVVVFPILARHAAAGRHDALRLELARSLQIMALMLIPLGAGMLWFTGPVVHDLFEGGEFKPADTYDVALLVACHIGVVVGGGLGEIVAKMYYAMGDTRTPIIVSIVGFTLGVLIKFLWTQNYGLPGMVGATSYYYMQNVGIMLLILALRLGNFFTMPLFETCWRAAAGTVAAAMAARFLLSYDLPFSSVWAMLAGGPVYVVVLGLLGEKMVRDAWRHLPFRPGARRATETAA